MPSSSQRSMTVDAISCTGIPPWPRRSWLFPGVVGGKRISASPVRSVGPGRGQQRHVVVGRRVGHAEADCHPVEERRVSRARLRLPRKVLANPENELVLAPAQLSFLDQRRVGSSLGVRAGRREQATPFVGTVEAKELHLHVGGGTTTHGIQDVGGQVAGHGHNVSLPSLRCPRSSRTARSWRGRSRCRSPSRSVPGRRADDACWEGRGGSSLPRGTLRVPPCPCGRGYPAPKGCSGR